MTLKKNDSMIIVSLLSGSTVEEAASHAGVSPRTVHRRHQSPEFKAVMNDVNYQIL